MKAIKPNILGIYHRHDVKYKCPKCSRELHLEEFCPNCGQSINWGVVLQFQHSVDDDLELQDKLISCIDYINKHELPDTDTTPWFLMLPINQIIEKFYRE